MAGLTQTSTFFANKGVITVAAESGSPTTVTLAVVKDCEVNITAEHVPLYGWGSVMRQAVARHTLRVGVKIAFCKFSPAVSGSGASPWFPFWIINPTTGDGTTADTNTAKVFTVTMQFENESGEKLLATIHDVYFQNFPLKLSENTWMRVDLDGEGASVTFTNP